jgi:hypothetical protein
MDAQHNKKSNNDGRTQCLMYIREETGCGMALISKCLDEMIKNLKNRPHLKMDVGQVLKMEWQEYDLRG